MPQVIFLPHEEICPEGASIEAEPGISICDLALKNGIADRVEHETSAFDMETRGQLVARGHRLVPQVRPFGDMQAILWHRDDGRLEAASDPRGEGGARVLSE